MGKGHTRYTASRDRPVQDATRTKGGRGCGNKMRWKKTEVEVLFCSLSVSMHAFAVM
jgi:hypothetical protein